MTKDKGRPSLVNFIYADLLTFLIDVAEINSCIVTPKPLTKGRRGAAHHFTLCDDSRPVALFHISPLSKVILWTKDKGRSDDKPALILRVLQKVPQINQTKEAAKASTYSA